MLQHVLFLFSIFCRDYGGVSRRVTSCHVVNDPREFENGQHVLLDVSTALNLVIKHSVPQLCHCMKYQDEASVSSHRIRPGGSVVTRPFSSIPRGANAKLCRRYDFVNYCTNCTSRLLTIPISHVFCFIEAPDVDTFMYTLQVTSTFSASL
jgi:hypothetical protein